MHCLVVVLEKDIYLHGVLRENDHICRTFLREEWSQKLSENLLFLQCEDGRGERSGDFCL